MPTLPLKHQIVLNLLRLLLHLLRPRVHLITTLFKIVQFTIPLRNRKLQILVLFLELHQLLL